MGPPYHGANLPWGPRTMGPPYQEATVAWGHLAMGPPYLCVTVPWGHHTKRPPYHRRPPFVGPMVWFLPDSKARIQSLCLQVLLPPLPQIDIRWWSDSHADQSNTGLLQQKIFLEVMDGFGGTPPQIRTAPKMIEKICLYLGYSSWTEIKLL